MSGSHAFPIMFGDDKPIDTRVPLPNFRAAMAQQDAGTKSPVIVALGDSTDFGSFSAGASNAAGVDCNSGSWPAHLRTNFANSGRATSQNALIANGIAATTEVNSANDPAQTVLGAQWQRTNPKSKAVGGYSLLHTSTTHTPNTYTNRATNPCDTFRVWYTRESASPDLLLSVDGGAVTRVVTANATASTGQFDMAAGSVGNHALTINTDTAGDIIILGVEAFNSTIKELKIRKGGWAGSRTTAWLETTNPWSPMSNLAAFAPDLTTICLGINHWIQAEASAPVATFQSDLTTLVTYYKSISDTVIITPVPSQDGANGAATIARQNLFVSAMKTVGANLSVPVIDAYGFFGSYNAANANGWMTNATHPSSAGYKAYADFVYSRIKA